ncbi:endoribonuclease YbeY isoform X3 [Mus pahari]|uniref:endoribonuclease YbeY isoform X3 n=1 Tax=Mus pahari TaxID=10093 RepID=UPI0011146E8D|nr:endoribonuclease YbeY isoform X3 [Mus pahari]
MSLVIKNLQRVVPIRRVPLRRKMDLVRSILGVKKFDLGIICVDNKTIQNINRIYRNKNVPTDVLSFPFHENLKAGEFPQPHSPDDYNLGDIFLGVEYILQHCRESEDYCNVLTRCRLNLEECLRGVLQLPALSSKVIRCPLQASRMSVLTCIYIQF